MLYWKYIKANKVLLIIFLFLLTFLICNSKVFADGDIIKDSNYGKILISENEYKATFNFDGVEPRTISNLFVLNKIGVDNKSRGGQTVYRMYMNIKEICDITNNIYTTGCNYDSTKNMVKINLHNFNQNNFIEYNIYFYEDKIKTEVVEIKDGITYTIANNERVNSSNENENNNEKEASLLIIGNEKYVPVRIFSEVLYYDVTFNLNEKSATIDTYNILKKDKVSCSMVNKNEKYYLYNECENKKIYLIPATVKIYLSPSVQINNAIYGGLQYKNESEIMNKVADYIMPTLEQRGIVVFRNKPTMKLSDIVDESKSLNVNAHFAVHSNAGDKPGQLGPEVWIHKNSSKEARYLADKIYTELLKIYPDKSKGRGIKDWQNLMETNPDRVNNGVLVEIAFHDMESDVLWIINNFELIGTTLGNAIADFYGMKQ